MAAEQHVHATQFTARPATEEASLWSNTGSFHIIGCRRNGCSDLSSSLQMALQNTVEIETFPASMTNELVSFLALPDWLLRLLGPGQLLTLHSLSTVQLFVGQV